jgi:signal transduction histidine kinase
MRLTGRRPDVAVGLVGAAIAVAVSVIAGAGPLQSLVAGFVGGGLGLARARPTTAWIVAAGAFTALDAMGGNVLVSDMVAVTAFAAGRWAERTSAIVGLVVLTSLSLICAVTTSSSAVPYLLVPVLTWLVGRALYERERVARRLSERARELEEEQDAYAELSVKYERARIAAELHDIVAHAISVMVVQASAGQRLAATNAELTAEAFGAIAGAAHQAEDDMSRLITLLADDQATAHAPDLELIKELVARASGTGLGVNLSLEGDREGLPSEVTQAATRVVQEGLTNALRYASGTRVRVLVRGDHDALIVEVANEPAPTSAVLACHGTGNGLRGLHERVSTCGGQLEAGPTTDGGWRIRARIPRHVTATAT